jgi:hypothetical protein
MKQLFFFSLFLIIFTSNAQVPQKAESLYPFQNYYLSLDKLTVIVVDGIPAKNFKTESKYACRFQVPVWFKTYPTKIEFGDKTFSINEKEEIEIKDNKTSSVKTIPNKDEDIKTESVAGSNFLFISDAGIVNVKRLWGNFGYAVRIYDTEGNEIRSFTFEHTKYIYKENVNYAYPYLNFLTFTPVYGVFTSYDNDYKKSVIINLTDGKTKEIDKHVNGVILAEDEKNIIGYIGMDQEKKTVTAFLNDSKINLEAANYYYYDAETVVNDSILVLATYSKLATGSSLTAHSIKTGKLLWEADVKQFNADHSEYYNNIILSIYSDKVIMEGTEAFGSYLQIFDIKTGKRLFVSGDFKDNK